LVVVAGPTGSGKTDLALHLAEAFDGEIINCDSIQVYRHLSIGAAKLPPEQRRGIRHHLLDVADPDQVFTAGDFSRLGRGALREITARGRLPIVAGGTGFYLRALLDGLSPGPARDEVRRRRLAAREQRRPGALHAMLSKWDPPAAGRIHPHDVNKLMRAVEVMLIERRPMSRVQADARGKLEGYRWLKIGLDPPRRDLYARIDARAARMFEQGLVEEVQSLLAMQYSEQCKPFEALGYRQALRLLKKHLSPADAVTETQLRSRQYAKRQLTWFRREAGMTWIHGFGGDPQTRQRAIEMTRAFLAPESPAEPFPALPV